MSREDATFRHPAIAGGRVLGLGCGNSMERGDTLQLGPLAARFTAF